MSEFYCQVVPILKIDKHPNADSLSIVQVMNGYPCIIRTGSFKEGDLAVYVSIDAMVPAKDPRFSFLTEDINKEWIRIKAKKLRGIFSMGLLVPADPSWIVGQDVQEQLGIKKYEALEERAQMGTENEKDLSGMPVYTDIEGLRKHKSALTPGEEVVLTEKIHGCLKFDSYVKLADGSYKMIKDIEVGEYVKSFDGKSFINKKVVEKIVRDISPDLDWMRLEFRDIMGDIHTIECTTNHLIHTDKGWKEAQNITEEDNITATI